MSKETANIYCYIMAGMSAREFAMKMLLDYNGKNKEKFLIKQSEKDKG